MGTLALVGGDEFRPACEPMDRALLALVGDHRPRVVIVPTAAAQQGPGMAAKNGERWFAGLGAETGSLMVLSARDASDPKLVSALNGYDIVYLTGGDPALLPSTLEGSAFAEGLRRRLREGAIIAGSSAGAMALGEAMRCGAAGWRPALGLARGVAVLPHHGAAPLGDVRSPANLPHVTPLGIPTATAVMMREGATECEVVGARPVTVYAPDGPRTIPPGQRFSLPSHAPR